MEKNMINAFLGVVMLIFSASTLASVTQVHRLHAPKGFQIHIYADNVPDARSLALADNNVVFVSTRSVGRVYALIPNKDASKAAEVKSITKGLHTPNGIAVYKNDLYVAETNRILKFPDIQQQLKKPTKPVVISRNLPNKWHHGWRYIAFSPDGWLYVAIGAPCNICLENDKRFGSIARMKPDGSNFEIFAYGVRNSVGMDFDPLTGDLWFTDNGRDWLGDNRPPDELNHAAKAGLHFGFPFYHGDGSPDPEFGKRKPKSDFTFPVQQLGPHVASLGMSFYRGTQFPEPYRNQIFIAEHGSWNRSEKIGYRVTLVKRNGNQTISYEPFITGWLRGQRMWGRPVDILEMPDGALLISDDYAGVVYRVTYQ